MTKLTTESLVEKCEGHRLLRSPSLFWIMTVLSKTHCSCHNKVTQSFHTSDPHFVGDLFVPFLLVVSGVAINLVHANADLVYPRRLINLEGCRVSRWISLALWFPLRNRSCDVEVTICWNHDESNVNLCHSTGHVLDEILCPGASMTV